MNVPARIIGLVLAIALPGWIAYGYLALTGDKQGRLLHDDARPAKQSDASSSHNGPPARTAPVISSLASGTATSFAPGDPTPGGGIVAQPSLPETRITAPPEPTASDTSLSPVDRAEGNSRVGPNGLLTRLGSPLLSNPAESVAEPPPYGVPTASSSM